MHIVIVGAGPAGLGAARHCQDFIKDYDDGRVTVFEKTDKIGGIWNGDEDSPIYRDLHTNLPKELMAFPDFPFHDTKKSFIHHQEVTKYLQQYSKHFELEKV